MNCIRNIIIGKDVASITILSSQSAESTFTILNTKLREKFPNTEFFMVSIFPFLELIQESTDQKKLRICTFFTQWQLRINWHVHYVIDWSKNTKFLTKSFFTEAANGVWLIFVAKLSRKTIFFFLKKHLCFLQNIHYLQKKMFLYGKKSFVMKNVFTEKNFFCREKYKWKCKKYIKNIF